MITISITAILLFILPWLSTRPYVTPRDTLLAVLWPICFLSWGLSGYPVSVDPQIIKLAAGIVATWIIASIFAHSPHISIKHAYRFTGIIFLGLLSNQSTGILPAVVLCGVASAVVGLLQQINIHIDKFATGHGGLIGNANMQGAFLMPIIFIAQYLAIENPIYYFAEIIMIWGLLLSRTRGAMIGTLVGAAYLFHWSAIPIAIVFIAVVAPFGELGARRLIWACSRRALSLKVAIFGLGVYNSRCLFPTQLVFFDGKKFQFRRAHNDILQMILDAGVLNAALYISIIVLSIYRADNPYLAAGLVGLAVHGLVFHGQSITAISLVTWILIGQVNIY